MENWGRFFHYNNKVERESQSTTMHINRREVSADFKSSRHRETTTISTKTKVKITILNTFYCVTECLPLTSSEKDDFPDCRSCRAVSLAVVARTVLLNLTKISEANGFRKSGRTCTRQIALAEDPA